MEGKSTAAQEEIQPKAGAEELPSGISDAIEAGMERFGEGHPAAAAVWDEGEEEGGEAAAGEEAPAAEGAPSGEEAPAAAGEAAVPKEDRFASQEAAEEGYRNLQAKHTKAEQELARYKEAERKKREADTRAEQGKAFADQVREFSKEKNAEALQKIDDLDPDDFDDDAAYNARVAEIWADKDSEVAAFMHAPPAAERPSGEEAPAGEGEAPAGGEDAAGAQATWDDVVATAQAQDQGFDTQDPAFISYCRMAPKEGEDGKELPFEDQVAWAVNQTKDYHQRLVRGTAAERSEGHQRRNAPMGRGGSPPGGPAGGTGGKGAPQPVSLDDAVSGALESRRL